MVGPNAIRTGRWCVLALSALILACAGCGKQADVAPSGVVQTSTLRISVEDIHCQSCVDAITQTVSRIQGVHACEVSLEKKEAVVTVDDPSLAGPIVEQINKLGYTARSAES